MGSSPLLAGVRVLDLSTDIAGSYCTKLLADAGADVVKVEGPDGDPLRRWTAAGPPPPGPDGADGALFQYLNGGKGSVVGALGDGAVRALCAGADVVVDNGASPLEALESLRRELPHLVVVCVSPFGRTGPWRDRAATEFTLQALAGSTGGRGDPESEPIHAGGRLGEWIAGTYAAVAALAAQRAARLSGHGDLVDVSALECMAITMGGYASVSRSMGGPPGASPARTVELPSIEPSADGFVGFCTVTGQQFQDFLALIERPDLIDDADLASFPGRHRRRHEFLPVVWDWTTKRSTDDIIDVASAMRIPVSPIGTPETVTCLDQFVERKVFLTNPGGFTQPRVPYRTDGEEISPPRPAPALDEQRGAVSWEARPSVEGAHRLPLEGVRVVDFTAFWAGPAATQVLALLGADVVKVESVQRPDGMRFAGGTPGGRERWYEWGSLFQIVNVNKRGITLDLGRPEGRSVVRDLIAASDVVIENFSPRVFDNFGLTRDELRTVNPRAVVVRMPAFGLDGPWRERTGFAQTMEQATGMAWLTGFADGPAIIPRGPCDPIAGMHAAFVAIAALEERDRSGQGHFVESTMVEAALNVAAEMVVERSAYGRSLKRDGNRGPVAAPQGVYPGLVDETWLALAVRSDEEWGRLVEVMGRPDWAAAEELATDGGRRSHHDALDAGVAAWTRRHAVFELVELLQAAGIPAERVVEPEDVIDNPQFRARGFVEAFDHPIVGRHEMLGLPFRFHSRPGGWVTAPAPMLGQHNDEVLGGLLGLSPELLADHEERRIIGTDLA